MRAIRVVQLALTIELSLAAVEECAHYHHGKLEPYQIGPPSVLLSQQDEERLRQGKPVMQAVEGSDAQTRRLLMVQDIPAPHSVVLGRIVDFERYDKMVKGVDRVVNYAHSSDGSLQTIKSTYEIHAAHLKFKYFMEHTIDPVARCVTFHLDYDKRSDLDDSVGYWYIEPRGKSGSRVYYSCECKLRGWTPPLVVNIMTKEALKQATTWVHAESVKEWRSSNAFANREALVSFVSNARESIAALKDATPPLFISNLLSQQRRAVGNAGRSAVRFVSSVAAPKPGASPLY